MKIKRKKKMKPRKEIRDDKFNYNRELFLSILFFVFFAMGPKTEVKAQCELNNSVVKSGEKLSYTLFFHWGILWKEAGEAEFTTEKTTYKDKKALKMNLLVASNEVADNFFRMRDTITSIVSEQLEPLYFRKAAEEGKRYTIDEAVYEYKDNQSYITQKRTWKDGKSQKFYNKSNNCIYDMLSVIGKARSMDEANYKKGDQLNIEMSTGKTIEKLVLEYKGIEKVKAENSKTYKCMVFTLLKKNKKNKMKDFISLYISNDDEKLLVKLKFELNFGSAQVTLKDIQTLN